MKKVLLALAAVLAFGASPALAWGDICESSQRQFHKEFSIMNMCQREGGCSPSLHAAEAKKALQKGRNAGCPWSYQ